MVFGNLREEGFNKFGFFSQMGFFKGLLKFWPFKDFIEGSFLG